MFCLSFASFVDSLLLSRASKDLRAESLRPCLTVVHGGSRWLTVAHGDTMALILHRVYLREWCRNMQKPDMYQLVGTHNMTETAADGTIANPGNGLNILEPIHRIKDIFELNYWGKIWMNSCSTCVLLILAGRVQVLQESNATCTVYSLLGPNRDSRV